MLARCETEKRLSDPNQTSDFERILLEHLDAAFSLARWLTRNEQDAEDVVQEAYLRALRFGSGFRGGNLRAWLLTIVRNTAFTWLRQNRPPERALNPVDYEDAVASQMPGPDEETLRNADRKIIVSAIEELPLEYREVIVMRDIEGLAYKEIADIADVPLGTVMSRLARARRRLQHTLTSRLGGLK